jgi:hypothetical protein
MASGVCKYCGRDVKPMGNGLSSDYGITCQASPTKKHVMVSDPPFCIYCGRETKPMGNGLATSYGQTCNASPNRKHILQE